MKHWILEVGNTRTKWACFDAQAEPSASPVEVHSAAASDARTASTWRDAVGPEDKVMVTGSGDLDPWASAFPEAMVLRPGDPTPLPTDVTAPEGLGLDRVANAWAVLHHGFADATCHDAWLIVDVGTCITMDVVRQGKHLGGSISPGIEMRMRAMAEGTARLPQPAWRTAQLHPLSQTNHIGRNTEEALLRGGLGGAAAEIEGTWASLTQEIPNLGVVLTGGDAPRLELRSILPKFADAHLTLKGFHGLLNHLHA